MFSGRTLRQNVNKIRIISAGFILLYFSLNAFGNPQSKKSGKTLDPENYDNWAFSSKVTINTTSSGANVTGDVTNFPLLVRLDKDNFNFSQAKPDGTDIRFSKSDGVHLFYDRERWDANNELAEFWVLVDEITGNNDTQYINMHWGKPDAPDSSKPEEVYKTSNNFQAVWHLNEDPSQSGDCIIDRTGNSNDGDPANMSSADLVNGTIGKGIDFDGSNDYINAGSNSSLDNIQNLTIETWVYPRGWGGNNYGRIVDKADSFLDGMGFFLSNYGSGMGTQTFAFIRDRFFDTTVARASNYTMSLNAWAHVVVVMNGSSSIKLFHNGSETSYLENKSGSGTLLSEALYDLYIGNSSSSTNPRPFSGIIDELRISNSTRTASWIKLGYQTQRAGQNTVTVNPVAEATIIKDPVTDTVAVGDNATFVVTAIGDPIPTYQWQRYFGVWMDIIGVTDSIYSIPSASFSDTGLYRAIASNDSGSDTSSAAALLVYETITITSHPEDDTVLVGETVEFWVIATGGTFTYQWQSNKGGWHNLFEGENVVYSFVASADDDGTEYRCVVTSGPVSDTSNSARLTIGTLPIVPDQFPIDTVVPTGDSLLLTGTATGIPAPVYKWYFIPPSNPIPVLVDTGTTLSLVNTSKGDSGTYFFTASNKFGTITSDSLVVLVLDPVSIVIDLPATYSVFNGHEAILQPDVKGDGIISYQWYENGALLPGEIGYRLSINPVDSTAHDGNTYYCIMSNEFLGIPLGTVTTSLCTLKVGKFYDPFKIKAERVSIHNTTDVIVRLWSDVDISNFPSTISLSPWADSVWVMYKTNGYAADTSEAPIVKFAIEEIKNAAPDSVDAIIFAGPLPVPNDSCYWLSHSIYWHNPGFTDTLLMPFTPANKVFMVDTSPPVNPLVVHGEYVMKTDTAKVIVDSIYKLDALLDSLVAVQCSRYPDFIQSEVMDTQLVVSDLLAGGNSVTLITTRIGPLPIEKDTVYCRWYVTGKNAATSEKLDTTFDIGWERPEYTGILTADSTARGDWMHLEWTAPQGGTDSVRIWWNTSPIPLVHNPSLPVHQAHYPASVAQVIDTVKGLTNNTVYYFGLQIFKDDMWSNITEKSSDTAKTATGDTVKIPNVISMDSTWFDSKTNSMIIEWHIDLSVLPPDRSYECAYTYAKGLYIDTLIKPLSWDSIATAVNVTEIPLYPDIWFDTTYTIGLWLRGVHPIFGPTVPAVPADSSTTPIDVPSFTWQEVKFFPDGPVEYAANLKIILEEVFHFVHMDTLWAYRYPAKLPAGFVSVGCVPFEFGNKNPGVPPFMLGMRYGSLPPGVTESDLGLYRVINGEFHAVYNFEVQDTTVWAELAAKDLAYPFIVLADTVAPRITISPFSDTISKGSDITTCFRVADNVANMRWEFNYGAGNEGYSHCSYDTLSTLSDTTDTIVGVYLDYAISDRFGVRSLIIIDDAVHCDTFDISRCVRINRVEVINVSGHDWTPLRTAAGLDEPSLEKVFDRSILSDQPWEYDITNFRIYRWHTLDDTAQNSWLEYSDTVKQEFDFLPGRLIWSKTAWGHQISMGKGVTTTLKEPYLIALKPKNWTDITLPFQFPILLRDVLEASGAASDSLEVYYWEKDGYKYSAKSLYIWALDTIDYITDTLISHQKHDGYTFYNNYSTTVMLFIPPTSLALSKYTSVKKREASASKNLCDVSLRWRDVTEGEGLFVRKIRCAYRQGEGKTLFGSLPPSMGKTQVGIYDSRNGGVYGWVLKQELDDNGGMTFEICFDNRSGSEAKIEYYLDESAVLPDGFEARVYNTKRDRFETCTEDNVSSVKMGSENSTLRILAIGPERYFDLISGGFLPVKLLKVYPNPFNGLVKIHYRIPFGMKEIRFTLFNLQGKMLWKYVNRGNLHAGEHLFHFDGKRMGANGKALPAGVYILRLTAKDLSGKAVYGGNKRVICIK